MTAVTHPSLPNLRKTRFDVIPGKPISVQDFLRGLKRPAVVVTPARTLHDAVPARPSLIEVPEDLHLLDPPESCPQEEISDKYDDVDPSPKTEEPMRATNRATEEERESMEAPKVLRTYAKRKRPTPSPAERQKTESPALFCTQESAEPHDESHRHPETEPLLSREPHMKMKPRNKREPHQDKLPDAKKRKRAASIKAVESEPPATPESDNNVIPRIKKKTKRKEQKKRRAPVNELALVSKLPAQIDSQAKPKRSAQVNNALGIEPVESQEPTENFATHVRKANIGKPVTRLRRDITVPPQCSISHEGFKVPPATPKTTRFPGWKLGSGFEGINFDTTHGKGSIRSYKGKSKRLKTPRFTRPCLRPLELTTESSPTERKLRPKWQLETGASAVPPEQHTRVTSEQSSEEAPEAEARPIIDEAAADSEVLRTQVQTLATLLRPPNEARNPETSGRSQTASTPVRMVLGCEEALAIRKDDLDSSPSIRQPSKSERNGWLKRRRKVSFADINDLGPQERVVEESQEDLRENTEDPFEAHNAVWYNETQPKSPLQDFAHEKSHTFQGEAIEEGEDILDNSPSQNASYPKSQVFSGSLKDTAPRAGGSPTKFPRRSIMRAPSSQFQIATSSRPLEVQNSQEQRDMRRSAKKPAPNSRRTTKRQADGLFSDDERDFRHIEETWPESVDLDRHTKYVLPEACLGGGRYFSNAVQQLSSSEKGLQSVPRRKSHTTNHYGSNEQKENIRVGFETHEGAHHVSVSPTKRQRPSQAEQGSLELGMTPRLRRTMSSVPFKPPFKDLV